MTLTDDELRVALANVGVDITCGACAEMFYTGHRNAKHTCANQCDRCRRPIPDQTIFCTCIEPRLP